MQATPRLAALVANNLERCIVATSLLAVALIAWLASGRDYLGLGVETDFFVQFLPEAERLLSGEALELPFHPPLYPALLALGKLLTGDWITGGFAISITAAAAALALSFFWVRALAGNVVAAGACVGLCASVTFVAHAGLVSSDVVFLALFVAVCYVAAVAERGTASLPWFVTGALIGFAILTRTNGVTLLAAAVLPWLNGGARLRNSSLVLAGAFVTLALWTGIALLTDSAIAPANTHVSLAWYYYRRDLFFDDASALLTGQFHSTWDVVSRDPVGIAKQYASDLYALLQRLLSSDFVLNSPANLLALPGLVYLAATNNAVLRHLALLVAPQLLLVNLAFPDQRYYLFLTPLFGAGAMATLPLLFGAITRRSARIWVTAFVAACWLLAVAAATRGAVRIWTANQTQLDELTQIVESAATPDSLLVARKPQIGYYTGVSWDWVPPTVQNVDELRDYLGSRENGDVLLYVGPEEVRVRPYLGSLVSNEAPPWLASVARGTDPAWVLFRYTGERP
jgi:hypothetical protein